MTLKERFKQIGKDKKLHFGAGFVISVWGFFAGRAEGFSHWGALALALGSVFVAAMMKEFWDEITYGGADFKDVIYTVAGAFFPSVILFLIF